MCSDVFPYLAIWAGSFAFLLFQKILLIFFKNMILKYLKVTFYFTVKN